DQSVPVPATRRRSHLLEPRRKGPRTTRALLCDRTRERDRLSSDHGALLHRAQQRPRQPRQRCAEPLAFHPVPPRRGELPVEVTASERYASGGEPPELPAQNVVKAFYATADRLGDELAIRDEARDVELSWEELRKRVHRIAGGLAKLGVEKGDTV